MLFHTIWSLAAHLLGFLSWFCWYYAHWKSIISRYNYQIFSKRISNASLEHMLKLYIILIMILRITWILPKKKKVMLILILILRITCFFILVTHSFSVSHVDWFGWWKDFARFWMHHSFFSLLFLSLKYMLLCFSIDWSIWCKSLKNMKEIRYKLNRC